MQHRLTYIEAYRRLAGGSLAIVGMYKKYIDEPVELTIEDLSAYPIFAGKLAADFAFLIRYTSRPSDEWDEATQAACKKLGLDPLELYDLGVEAELVWEGDGDIELLAEPTPDMLAYYWSNSDRSSAEIEAVSEI